MTHTARRSAITLLTLALAAQVVLADGSVATTAPSARSEASVAAAIWHEGEDLAAGPFDRAKVVGEKKSGSGRLAAYGQALNTKGFAIRYEVTLPEAVPAARVIFRYGRQHWKAGMTAARVPLELAGPGGAALKGEVVFGDTKGWGSKPAEWQLAEVAVGDLAAGKWSVTLITPADDSEVNIDGFFIAPAAFKLTGEELAALLRVRIIAAGYLGLRAGSEAVDQKAPTPVIAVVRSFTGAPGAIKATLASAKGESVELKQVDAKPEGTSGAQRLCFAIPSVADGSYVLKLRCEQPPLALETPVVLVGEVLARFDASLAALEAFGKSLDANEDSRSYKGEFDYAIEYLRAKGGELRKYAAPAVAEGLPETTPDVPHTSPAAWQVDVSGVLAQYEETAARLKRHEDPYAGRTGDFHRSFDSKAKGAAIHYRLCVPTRYAATAKVPLLLALHGGKGTEDGMNDTDNGKLFELAEKRGYLVVCPQYQSDRQGTYMAGLLELIDKVRGDYPKIDAARIYATGFSMGGFASSQLGTAHPEVFAAICCQGGAGFPDRVDGLRIPTMVIQGGADPVVKPTNTNKTVARMMELGIPLDVHVEQFAGHEFLAEKYMTLAFDFFDQHAQPVAAVLRDRIAASRAAAKAAELRAAEAQKADEAAGRSESQSFTGTVESSRTQKRPQLVVGDTHHVLKAAEGAAQNVKTTLDSISKGQATGRYAVKGKTTSIDGREAILVESIHAVE